MTSRSWAEQIDFRCPACQRPLSLQTWVLIDSQERPDLVKRIGNGTLNTMTCPRCNNKTTLDVPLFVYRADGDPSLLFSPSRQIPREKELDQLQQLWSRLQQQPETMWINEFTFGIQGVKREQLPSFLGVDLKAILDELGESSDWERVIALTARALEILSPEEDPRMWATLRERWAVAQIELAAKYGEQVEGEKTSNLEKAIYHGQQALNVLTQDSNPTFWALAHHNLAIAHLNRIAEDRKKNLKQAVFHHREALKVYTFESHPKDWALEQEGLANVYCEIFDKDRSKNLEEAIHCLTRTLDVHTAKDMPLEYARTLNNLAMAYFARIEGDPIQNLEKAMEGLKDCLKVVTRQAFPELWASTHLNLGKSNGDLYRLRKEIRYGEEAVYHFEQALEIFTFKRFPARHRQCQRNLGAIHFRLGHWQQAHFACASAIDADRVLLSEAYSELGRRAEVSEARSVYPLDAYCLLRLGQPDEALVRLEQGKTRLLTEILTLDDVELLSLPEAQRLSILIARQSVREFEAAARTSKGAAASSEAVELAETLHRKRQELNKTIETIRAEFPAFRRSGLDLDGLMALVPEDGALVVPMITPGGSAAFVIPHGTRKISEKDHCVMADDCTNLDEIAWLCGTSDLKAAFAGTAFNLQAWLPAYYQRNNNAEAWLKVIEHTGQVLWEKLIGLIHQRLVALGLGEGAPMLFIVPGGMNLLPLHAAWREANGVKRYFMDDYTVSYGPSGYSLHVSQRRRQESKRQQRSLLAVVNPTADLDFAESEGAAVTAFFSENVRLSLPRESANREVVIQAVPDKSYLHFACHGFYRWENPMRSGLYLANKVPLTLGEIISELDLSACRLVTLSACETGITDITQSPDEYLGLPAGFLQAGAAAVVSTLWAVNDRSTMLLMERFYQFHLKDRLDIPDALCQAQIWLRDVTAGKLEQRFADEEEKALRGQAGMSIQTASDFFAYFASLATSKGKNYQPFAHPYYWAAFTFSGA